MAESGERRRWRLLRELENRLETPMIVLGLVWLVLLVLELTRGLPPPLATAGRIIWALFIAHFLLEFSLAPDQDQAERTGEP